MARFYEESQTPEWMRPLKKLHQRRKSEQSEKEEAERRKAEEERQRFEAMPAWKKQLIYKKRAKSAENLLSGCDVKNLNISETKELETVNSECNAKEEPVANGEVTAESVAETNGADDTNENGITDHEKCDEDTASEEVEKSVDEIEKDEHDKENGEVEDAGDDDEQAEDLHGNEDIEKIYEMADSVDSDEKVDIGDEENENHDELATESSHNSSAGEVSPAVPDDKEEESVELDEDEPKETGEQQVEGSTAELENNNEEN